MFVHLGGKSTVIIRRGIQAFRAFIDNGIVENDMTRLRRWICWVTSFPWCLDIRGHMDCLVFALRDSVLPSRYPSLRIASIMLFAAVVFTECVCCSRPKHHISQR